MPRGMPPPAWALGAVHRQIHEVEEDNVGVESAHKSEQAVETGVRLIQDGIYSHKLKPYRQRARAERQLEKAIYPGAVPKKHCRKIPSLPAIHCPVGSRSRRSSGQYAAAKRTAKTRKTAKNASDKAGKATRAAAEKAEQAANFVWRHRRGFVVAGVLYCWLPFCSTLCPPAP